MAAARLQADGVDVLHTIGGDDTNTAAADLAAYLRTQGSELTVVGLPKTIDNDIVPIRQSLGALTAAQQASRFAQNVLAEHGSNPRMLIVHEVMGRASGWLTAAAARDYMAWHAEQEWLPGIGLDPRRWAIHAVYVPERGIDLAAEADAAARGDGRDRLRQHLPRRGRRDRRHRRRPRGRRARPSGATPSATSRSTRSTPAATSPTGSPSEIGAEKQMVQKSGYFSRSAPANETDLALIREMAELAVACALEGRPASSGTTRSAATSSARSSSSGSPGTSRSTPTQAWFTELLRGHRPGLTARLRSGRRRLRPVR